MSQLDLAIVGIYMVATLAVGIYYGRKTDSFKDFAIGDRKIGTVALFATMFASVIGGSSILGLSGKVFQSGVVFAFIFFGRALGRMFIESPLIFRRMENCVKDSISPGDILGYFYGKPGKLILGLATVVMYTSYLGLGVHILGYLFEYFLGISFTQGALLGISLVVIYASFGGMRAVASTDALQFAALVIAIPLLAYWGLKTVGGYTPIFAAVPKDHLNLFPHGQDASTHFSMFAMYFFPMMSV
ncbi:MAG: hypothetical protein AAF320_06315, partial [Myxococcota bacterium]